MKHKTQTWIYDYGNRSWRADLLCDAVLFNTFPATKLLHYPKTPRAAMEHRVRTSPSKRLVARE